MENEMKKTASQTVRIRWTETHHYEAEIEIPDGLDPEEQVEWVQNNTDEWGLGWRDPDEINTDWDSFEIREEN